MTTPETNDKPQEVKEEILNISVSKLRAFTGYIMAGQELGIHAYELIDYFTKAKKLSYRKIISDRDMASIFIESAYTARRDEIFTDGYIRELRTFAISRFYIRHADICLVDDRKL
jgi:hypothetical protein